MPAAPACPCVMRHANNHRPVGALIGAVVRAQQPLHITLCALAASSASIRHLLVIHLPAATLHNGTPLGGRSRARALPH